MKNKNIHNGFDNENVRDFLSKRTGYGFDGEVEAVEKQINELQEKLKKAKESQATRDLIRLNGWSEFDVSDEIEDYKPGEYFNFVGTGDEYKQLKKKIK